MGIFDTIVSGIGAGMMRNANDKRQLKQQKKLMGIQMEGQQQMAEFNKGLAMQMWDETNYSAQRQQMEKAGLNPGLIYGMGGGGGTTTNVAPGNVSAGTAPTGGNEINEAMGLALQDAQKNLIKAQTDKTTAEADKTKGIDTEVAGANLNNLIANTTNTEAKTELTRIQSEITNIEKEIKDKTREDVIETLHQQKDKTMAETSSAITKARIDATTANTVIKSIEAEYAGILLKNDLTKIGITATQQQINKSIADIQQGWAKLNQDKTLTKEQHEIQRAEIARKTIETNFQTGVMAETERGTRIAKMIADGVGQFIPKTTTTTGSSSGSDEQKTWLEDYWTKTTK